LTAVAAAASLSFISKPLWSPQPATQCFEEEKPVTQQKFDAKMTAHYGCEGLNGKFTKPGAVAFFAGGDKGGGGKFEDPAVRDIAGIGAVDCLYRFAPRDSSRHVLKHIAFFATCVFFTRSVLLVCRRGENMGVRAGRSTFFTIFASMRCDCHACVRRLIM